MKLSSVIKKAVLASALPATLAADLIHITIWRLSKKRIRTLPLAIGIYLAACTYFAWCVCVWRTTPHFCCSTTKHHTATFAAKRHTPDRHAHYYHHQCRFEYVLAHLGTVKVYGRLDLPHDAYPQGLYQCSVLQSHNSQHHSRNLQSQLLLAGKAQPHRVTLVAVRKI
jgi:hypothetical protein